MCTKSKVNIKSWEKQVYIWAKLTSSKAVLWQEVIWQMGQTQLTNAHMYIFVHVQLYTTQMGRTNAEANAGDSVITNSGRGHISSLLATSPLSPCMCVPPCVCVCLFAQIIAQLRRADARLMTRISQKLSFDRALVSWLEVDSSTCSRQPFPEKIDWSPKFGSSSTLAGHETKNLPLGETFWLWAQSLFNRMEKSSKSSHIEEAEVPNVWGGDDRWWPFLSVAYDLAALPNISSNYGLRAGGGTHGRIVKYATLLLTHPHCLWPLVGFSSV